MPSVRRHMLPALLILVFASAWSGTAPFARDTDKSWEFGAGALVARYAGGSNIDTGFGWVVRGGYHLKAIHEIEGSYDTASADDVDVPGLSYDITKFSADYLRNFLVKGHEKMTPFALFGLGVMRVDNHTDSLSTESERFGGGLKYFIKPHGGLRFDLTVFHWHGDDKVVPRNPYFSMDITVAATFLVGGGK
jgi:outer membrane protein with beta-barrel domain